MRKWFPVLVLFILFVIPIYSHAQQNNAGFVQGLWYSTSTQQIFAGKPIRIYVAVRNNTGSDLTGTVSFLDGTAQIGTKTIQAIDGHIVETWTDWNPTYGTHTISANLSRVQLSDTGSSSENTTVTSPLAQDIFFVGIAPLVQTTKTNTQSDTHTIISFKSIPNDTSPSQSSSTIATSTASSTIQGLEQFIPQGAAQEALAQVTNAISKTKQALDTYRTTRDQQLYKKDDQQHTIINAQGFGPITRTVAADRNKIQMPTLTGSTTLDKVFSGGKMIGQTFYTWFLSALSFALGKPIFIQVAGMVLMLFLLFKFAAKFGRRKRGS